MVKFSTIMKGGEKKKERFETPPEAKPVLIPPEPQKFVPEPSLKPAGEETLPDGSVSELFHELVSFMQDIITRMGAGEKVSYKDVAQEVSKLVDDLMKDPNSLSPLIQEDTPGNYIVAHQIGVCALSLEMGRQMGYGREKLIELGVGAFLFDIGMVRVLDIVKQKRKLGENEFDEVKRHPEYGAQMLKQFSDMPPSVIDMALQHHERPDGKGYPMGLKGREISEFSKVVSLADVYVALTHSRPERRRLPPHDAIKELLQNARFFSPTALRSLLSIISIYPVGTWVELNSHDVGKVIRLNTGQALRPVLELVCDHHGQLLEKRNVVDLMENPQLYITNVVDNAEIEKWGIECVL